MNPAHNCIEEIINLEWDMFQEVNADGPRTECQNNRPAFVGMRMGQFLAWPEAALELYLTHLRQCVSLERNLVMEKYVHMMKGSAPQEYEALKKLVVFPREEDRAFADQLCQSIVDQTDVLRTKYPHVASAGRPLYSSEDSPACVSLETYQRGEFYTYSGDVLRELTRHNHMLAESGRSFAKEILEHSVCYYGYESLDAAEEAARTAFFTPHV